MRLGVTIYANPLYEIDLGFEKVDMTFLVVHERLEQIPARIILHAETMGPRQIFWVSRDPPTMLCGGAGDGERSHAFKLNYAVILSYVRNDGLLNIGPARGRYRERAERLSTKGQGRIGRGIAIHARLSAS